jgi:hypothetical protein
MTYRDEPAVEGKADRLERAGTLPVAVLALATDAPHKLGAGLDCVLLDDPGAVARDGPRHINRDLKR